MIQHNYRSRYLVILDGDDVYIYKYEKCKFDQPFLTFKVKHIFIGKSKICKMTKFSGGIDSSGFDGNTILLKCEYNEYVYISGLEIFIFKTDDKIIDYISLMGNNMCAYAIAIGGKNTYFINNHYKFMENDKIEKGTLLNTVSDSLDPFDYHLGKCGADSFQKLEYSQIHSFYCDIEDKNVEEEGNDVLVEEDEEVETNFCNWTNDVVKKFNQKCVICYERDSVYAFRQCGQQCICLECCQKKVILI